MAYWKLQDAKQQFSEVVRRTESEGPQVITRHGEPVAVLVAMALWRQKTEPERDFLAFLASAPDVELEIERSPEPARTIAF